MEKLPVCPECGAPSIACETRYHECLVKEFSQADFGSVHHLTVAAYMVQHSSKLTRAGWLFERELLKEFLVDHKSPQWIRQQNKEILDSGGRGFNIADKNGLPKIPPVAWSKTILDVRLENAEEYCSDVTAWAQAVLKDAQSLLV